MNIEIIIPGPPIAKVRPRVVRRNGSNTAFDPQSWEKECISVYMKSMYREVPLWEFFYVYMRFYIPIPKSTSKKKAEELKYKPCPKKPDLDNYVKFYLDAGNGILWPDDSKIVYLECYKVYSDKPRTEICLTSIPL